MCNEWKGCGWEVEDRGGGGGFDNDGSDAGGGKGSCSRISSVSSSRVVVAVVVVVVVVLAEVAANSNNSSKWRIYQIQFIINYEYFSSISLIIIPCLESCRARFQTYPSHACVNDSPSGGVGL